MRKFLILAPSFTEDRGGVISLHKLCDVLNRLGHDCALIPDFENFEINRLDMIKPIGRAFRGRLQTLKNYKTHPDFHTPVINSPPTGAKLGNAVVIYPEIVSGNPLRAPHVVRWLLYKPGALTGKVHFGTGEMYIAFNSGLKRFEIPGSMTANDYLKIVHYPMEIYHPPPINSSRSGVAYLVRKNSSDPELNKPLVSHPADAICIDGRSHRDIANILRSVQTFVSYDPYTAYSLFAALTDCDSVVVPDAGVTEESWYPDPADRYGIAYGWDRLEQARTTRHLVRQRLLDEEHRNSENVRRFVEHVNHFFG